MNYGIMPNRKWKKLNKGENWQRGETLNTVIGQGFMLATPLQISLATMIASGKIISKNSIYKSGIF